jgi:hypothetical protein
VQNAALHNHRARIIVLVLRPANHDTTVVDRDGKARNVTGKRAEIGHAAVLPEEGVSVLVAGQVRITGYLALVVDAKCDMSESCTFPAEIAEIGRYAILPEQGVKRLETGQ